MLDLLQEVAPISPMWNRFNPFSMGGVHSPLQFGSLSTWYDISDLSSLVYDGSNRVSLVADKSGNSAVNVLVLNGVAGNYASAPDSAAVSITGDIDLRGYIAPNTWTAGQIVVAKYISTGNQKSYYLLIGGTGTQTIRLGWSTTGANDLSTDSTTTFSTPAYSGLWVRATMDVDDGAGNRVTKFYTSPDGTAWTQLGATVTTAGTTSIFDSTAVIEIGSANAGTGSLFTGLNFRSQIYNGYDGAGTLVFDANFATAAKLATSFTESSSNAATVTINTSGATGARICGARDLYQGMVANQPIYLPWSGTNYGYLNGVTGNYFSAPSAAPVQVTGDIDIRCFVAANDWTTSTAFSFLGRFLTGDSRSYEFSLDTAGKLVFQWTPNTDANIIAKTSSVATGISDSTAYWVRVTLDVDDGAGNNVVTFYTSSNGVTWSTLGTVFTTVGTTSIAAGTDVLSVGSRGSASQLLSGLIYRAQIYNGIAGTLVFDFNPAAYTSGTTFLDQSANAATITINGGATIVTKTCLYLDGSNDYLKAAAFALANPATFYGVVSQISWTSLDHFWDGNTADKASIQQATASPQLLAGGASGATANNSNLAIGTNGVITAVYASSGSLRVNRGTATTGNNASAAGINGFILGSYDGSTRFANITASEILVYAAADNTLTQDQKLLYLGRKWGIAV